MPRGPRPYFGALLGLSNGGPWGIIVHFHPLCRGAPQGALMQRFVGPLGGKKALDRLLGPSWIGNRRGGLAGWRRQGQWSWRFCGGLGGLRRGSGGIRVGLGRCRVAWWWYRGGSFEVEGFQELGCEGRCRWDVYVFHCDAKYVYRLGIDSWGHHIRSAVDLHLISIAEGVRWGCRSPHT